MDWLQTHVCWPLGSHFATVLGRLRSESCQSRRTQYYLSRTFLGCYGRLNFVLFQKPKPFSKSKWTNATTWKSYPVIKFAKKNPTICACRSLAHLWYKRCVHANLQNVAFQYNPLQKKWSVFKRLQIQVVQCFTNCDDTVISRPIQNILKATFLGCPENTFWFLWPALRKKATKTVAGH